MVNYSCPTCGKTFKQKGHYTKHLQKKTPCENKNLISNKDCDNTQEMNTEEMNTEEMNTEEMNTEEMNTQLSYIDLFCGIGGFHQALNKLDCKCVIACDIDKACRENYKLNYGIEPHPDVRKINPDEINEDIDIICGGFPCQAFSNAGKKKMFEDDRGLLFDEIMRIAKVKNPRFMFLENVKHILKVGDKKVIEYIKQKIDDLG
jgi:hypothetical protein